MVRELPNSTLENIAIVLLVAAIFTVCATNADRTEGLAVAIAIPAAIALSLFLRLRANRRVTAAMIVIVGAALAMAFMAGPGHRPDLLDTAIRLVEGQR